MPTIVHRTQTHKVTHVKSTKDGFEINSGAYLIEGKTLSFDAGYMFLGYLTSSGREIAFITSRSGKAQTPEQMYGLDKK